MSSNIPAVFNFTSESSVRVVQVEGNPWFVAADVCSALGVQNPSHALTRLDDDERSSFKLGRQGSACIINESGLYSLILGSRKPEAKRFKKWVTAEVLPSIRKTGSYSVTPPTFVQRKIGRGFKQTYLCALRIFAGQDGALGIGITELVFYKLGISSLDELTSENIDQAISVIAEDMSGEQIGLARSMMYRLNGGLQLAG